MGHALMENRNSLIVGAVTTCASGHAERLAVLALIEPHADRSQPTTLGADKGYDTSDFVMELRDKAVTPHVAQNQSGRRSAIDGRTTRHPGYASPSVSASASRRPSTWPKRWPACAKSPVEASERSNLDQRPAKSR
jgi:Transposase DDE domain